MSTENHKVLHFIKEKKSDILLIVFLLVLVLIESRGRGDFDIFISASRDLLNGGNIYEIRYHDWYHYYYDVLFALVISPLQLIPLYWANFIWLAFNVFFTFRIWKIILLYLPISELREGQKRLLTISSFVFIFALWHKNIHLTQMTIFILYLCLEGICRIQNKQTLLGSILIAVGISIKILPIILIPYLIYRGYYRATIYTILATVLILLFPAFIIGYDYHTFLLQERWKLINPLNKEHILDTSERSFHSLTTLLSVLLVEDSGSTNSLEIKRNLANVNMDTLKLAINVVRLFLIALTLFFIRSWPFQSSKNKLQSFYELSYILLVIPLIFPHQQHYSFFFIFPAITYLIFYLIIKYFDGIWSEITLSKKALLVFVVLAMYFLLNSHFILGAYQKIYDHFKTLTYGVILLIPLLAVAKPNNINQLLAFRK